MAALAVDEPHVASANEVRNRQIDQSADAHPSKVVKSQPAPASAKPPVDLAGAMAGEPQPQREQVRGLSAVASQKQVGLIQKLAREKQITDLVQFAGDTLDRPVESIASLSSRDASTVIKALMAV